MIYIIVVTSIPSFMAFHTILAVNKCVLSTIARRGGRVQVHDNGPWTVLNDIIGTG